VRPYSFDTVRIYSSAGYDRVNISGLTYDLRQIGTWY
jgi:hypothetical protein